jgi:uncharacterized protein (DUF983 family)
MTRERRGLGERDRYFYALFALVIAANVLPAPKWVFAVLIVPPAVFVVVGLANGERYLALGLFAGSLLAWIAATLSAPTWAYAIPGMALVALAGAALMRKLKNKKPD